MTKKIHENIFYTESLEKAAEHIRFLSWFEEALLIKYSKKLNFGLRSVHTLLASFNEIYRHRLIFKIVNFMIFFGLIEAFCGTI